MKTVPVFMCIALTFAALVGSARGEFESLCAGKTRMAPCARVKRRGVAVCKFDFKEKKCTAKTCSMFKLAQCRKLKFCSIKNGICASNVDDCEDLKLAHAEELRKISVEKVGLESSIEAITGKNLALESEIEDIKIVHANEVRTLNEEKADLESSIEVITGKKLALESEIEDMKNVHANQVRTLNEEKVDLESSIEVITGKNLALESEVNRLNNIVAALEEEALAKPDTPVPTTASPTFPLKEEYEYYLGDANTKKGQNVNPCYPNEMVTVKECKDYADKNSPWKGPRFGNSLSGNFGGVRGCYWVNEKNSGWHKSVMFNTNSYNSPGLDNNPVCKRLVKTKESSATQAPTTQAPTTASPTLPLKEEYEYYLGDANTKKGQNVNPCYPNEMVTVKECKEYADKNSPWKGPRFGNSLSGNFGGVRGCYWVNEKNSGWHKSVMFNTNSYNSPGPDNNPVCKRLV